LSPQPKGRKPRPGGPNTRRIALHLNGEEEAMLSFLCEAEGQQMMVVIRGLIRREFIRRNGEA